MKRTKFNRKYVSRLRKNRNRLRKSTAKAVRKIAKKVISNEAENKFKNTISAPITANTTGSVTVTSYANSVQISQGFGKSERVGNAIMVKSLKWGVHIQTNPQFFNLIRVICAIPKLNQTPGNMDTEIQNNFPSSSTHASMLLPLKDGALNTCRILYDSGLRLMNGFGGAKSSAIFRGFIKRQRWNFATSGADDAEPTRYSKVYIIYYLETGSSFLYSPMIKVVYEDT